MTWYINLMLLPLFFCLACVHRIFDDPNIITSSIGFIISAISLLIQSKTKDHKYVSVFLIIVGTFLCQLSIYVIADSQLISDLMWIILVAFYSFYVLGSTWGSIVLSINMLGLLIYLVLLTVTIPMYM